MIAKIIPIKSLRKSNFSVLVKYLTDPQGKNERIGLVSITNCYTDELTPAMLEIQNTQEMNRRTKSDKTCHLVLSFPEGERLSNAQLSEIEERFCEALGFREHQRISVVHDDTDHQHIHIAINKIHPRKLTIHNPYYDYKKVATLCEQIEQEYGLTQVNHETQLDKSSRIIRDIEAKAGIESLLGWIRRECLDDIKRADTWQVLHQLLQNNGLAIKERGNGLVFVSSHGVAVKASYVDRSLSKPNLVKRLGAFEAATHTVQTMSAQSKQYQPKPLQNNIDISRLFEHYQQQQAAVASWRKEQWLNLREQRDRLIERVKKDAKRKRSIIKQVQAGQLVKKTLYATVSGQFKATLDEIKHEYRAAYAQLKTSQRRMAWLDWLTVEAKNGNAEALSALRARSKKDGRIQGNHLSGYPNKNNHSRNDTVEAVTKDGTVCYRIGNTAIRDDGKRLFVSPSALNDSLADVLQVAIDKYGNHLSVNGSDDFKKSIVQAAVQNSLPVTFDDKALEHYRQQLLKQQTVSQTQRFTEIQAKANTTKARRNSL
ncbi:Relaxase/Mobilisation nuclease domain-containing protein [Nitrosomonas aestuarii]|uniref:Relaxase/Mobilisation nuclease domain-containing protein n=1 Tax=Nitrosomonas aestuarii TaxID=52441 RepID=A0A1I4D918_9PROT|nr:TraI/MobA(P) family conjugative relaxase [Nitrosomonas aestuarii]SFK88877.1 Relaxase/Mobilisation nuclease domain-containing protein [Nitrosomonas aestuarii]